MSYRWHTKIIVGKSENNNEYILFYEDICYRELYSEGSKKRYIQMAAVQSIRLCYRVYETS